MNRDAEVMFHYDVDDGSETRGFERWGGELITAGAVIVLAITLLFETIFHPRRAGYKKRR